MTTAILAGVKIETLGTTVMANATLVSVKGEVLSGGAPEAQVVAVKAEVLSGGAPLANLVAVKAEVMYPLVTVSPAGRRVVSIVMG